MSMKQNDETQSRWYMVNKDGMCTLCADQADAEQVAKDAQEVWPHMGPHRAVRLVEVGDAGFTAADMATAAAQGFRDGQAAQAAVAAGWQPIATAPKDEQVLIFMAGIGAIDIAHQRADVSRWVSGGGTVWPPGVCTHWMLLPPAPSTEGESGNGVAP